MLLHIAAFPRPEKIGQDVKEWADQDLNLECREATDLQSAAIPIPLTDPKKITACRVIRQAVSASLIYAVHAIIQVPSRFVFFARQIAFPLKDRLRR